MDHLPVSFILASQSPRRRELLRQGGYRFDVIPSTVDESVFDPISLSPEEFAKQLALAKARDVALGHSDQWVLGADTVIDCQGEMIGKPCDAADAELITRKVFAGPHRVITGVAWVHQKKGIEHVEADVTVVIPKPMTEAHIAEHIAGGTWEGKAGAYAIQETGDSFVERLEGSLTNVIGLPMELLERLFQDYNILSA